MVAVKQILFILLFAVTASAEYIPSDYQEWSEGNSRKAQFGGPPQNYPAGDSWEPIENDWITVDDTLYTNRRGALKTDVNDLGQIFMSIVIGEDTVTVAQRLLSLKWFRKSDSAWLNIDNTPQWGSPSVIDNMISWTNVFPDVNITVGKYNGRVDYRLHLKPGFLDSAVILYNQRADSADIYLANVIALELVGVADADSSLGTLTKERILRGLGRYNLRFNLNRLGYPQQDTLDPDIKVHQRHIIIADKLYMLEFVKMSALKWAHEKYPTETLWHNTTLNLQVGASADDCERVLASSFFTTGSWAAGPGWTSGDGFFDQGYRFTSVTVPNGATITSSKLSLYNRSNETAVGSYDLSAEDVDNSSDFSGDNSASFNAKVRTTASLVVNITSVARSANTYYEDTGLEAVIQEIVDRGSWSSGNALTIIADGTTTQDGRDFQVAHEDQGSGANAPLLEIIYTEDGGGATLTRRRKLILGG